MSADQMGFEEVLEREGRLIYSFKGVSMMPLLKQGRDFFVVEKTDGPFRKGDVILFKRGAQYVLHRIIRKEKGTYTALGDNSYIPDRHIREEDILGWMTGYIRKGKRHQVTELGYRLYSLTVKLIRPFRVFYRKIRAGIRKRIRTGSPFASSK